MFLLPTDGIIGQADDDLAARAGITTIQDTPLKFLPFVKTTELLDRRSLPQNSPTNWGHLVYQSQMHYGVQNVGLKHKFYWKCDESQGITLPSAWRCLYLTQPPIAVLTVGLGKQQMYRPGLRLATIFDKNGITLGLVADVVVKLLQQLPTELRDKVLSGRWGAYAEFLMMKPI